MLPSSPSGLREEIASVAARMIAEDGLDYAGAKRRAMREVIGDGHRLADCMPDNAEVEAAVREHQALFMADTQPARLSTLRHIAVDVMRFLQTAGLDLVPHARGAIVNGTAGEHSDIHLQVYADNAKDIEIFLLNAGVDFEASESGARPGDGETLSFLWPPDDLRRARAARDTREAVHLAVHDPRDRRSAAPGDRADLAALEALIAAAPAVGRDA